MMKFLRSESEAAARAAFANFTEDGAWPSYIGTAAVDVIGTIYRETGQMLETPDGEVPEMAPVPGYHINLSARVPELQEFEIETPTNPVRIFAGAVYETVDSPEPDSV